MNLPNPGVLRDPDHVLTVKEASLIFDQFQVLMKGVAPNDFRIVPSKARGGNKRKGTLGDLVCDTTAVPTGVSKKKTTPSASAKKKRKPAKKKKKSEDSDEDDGDSDYGS